MFKKLLLCVLVINIFIISGCIQEPKGPFIPSKEELPEEEVETQKLIDDLSYIKITTVGYSDDADPEDNGFAIDIVYYDSESEFINFKDIPILVHIELYGYRHILDTFEHNKMELIYKGSVIINHSMTFGEMFGNYIRIPFEDIAVDKDKYCEFGTIKVIVETLQQGNFSAIEDLILLYEAE